MFPKNVEWILSKLLKVRKKSKCLSINCFERINRATFVRCYVATEVNRREVRQNGERPSGFTVDRASYNWSCVHRPCRMLSKKTKKHNDCNADGRNSWSVMRAERSQRPEFISKSVSMNSDSQKTNKTTDFSWAETRHATKPNSHSSHMTDPPKTSAISPIWFKEFLDTLEVCCLRVTCEAPRAQRPANRNQSWSSYQIKPGLPSAVWFAPPTKII